VGHVAVQIARTLDANVFATGSSESLAYIRQLGATPIDYGATTVEQYVTQNTDGKGFDIVYDNVGGVTLDASFNAITRFGHVVSALGWGTHALAPLSFRNGTYSGVFTLLPLLSGEGRARHGEILCEATRLAEAGQLKPRLDPRRFGLSNVEEAHEAIEDRSARGKIVVEINQHEARCD
jgi:NADPH:quinone reductase-like Zn-dependent oxidoreductase